MKAPFSLALGAALCLLLTSCVVTSDNPLASPETALPDPHLVGIWHEEGADDETLEFSIKDAHWMHLEDRKKNKPPESYDMFVTVIDGKRFLNARHLGEDEQGHPTKQGYFIVRYEVADHVFSTWWMDVDKAAGAVRDGKLRGVIRKDKNSMLGNPSHPAVDVTLQDSGANIVKFIQDAGPEALFSDKNSNLYRAYSQDRQPGG